MKNKIKKILISISILFFVSPLLALAQGGVGSGSGDIIIPNPTKETNLLDLINSLLMNVALPIGAVLAVLYIIYAGFSFVTAQGNPKKIEDAKQRLLWALIGTGILLGAVGISKAVQLTVQALFVN